MRIFKRINIDNIYTKIIFFVVSAVLTFMAFPPADLSFLGWVCLVPALLAVRGSSIKQAFFMGYLYGVVFLGALLYWLVNVTVPGTIFVVLILAPFFALFFLAAREVFKRSFDILLLPFAWVILEFLRAYFLTGFPWGLLAYTQYRNINLIQIADFTGAYGVSFVLVAFNSALSAWYIRSGRKISYLMVALGFILMATSYGIYKKDNFVSSGTIKASVVQGNIPQTLKWEPSSAVNIIDAYRDLTTEAASEGPDIILWPETSYPYLINGDVGYVEGISDLSEKFGIPILAGMVYEEDATYYNSAVLFGPSGDILSKYYKIHLVPFGEYIPFREYFSFLRNYIDKPIGDFGKGTEYSLFDVEALTAKKNGEIRIRQISYFSFGVLICFEDVFPYVARTFVREGADFLVNITNDAWFGDTAASRQHMQASVFRAVENRVPLIRTANTGISCFISPFGEVSSVVEDKGREIFIRGVASDVVNIYPGRSYYTEYGDVFAYFCIMMCLIILSVEIIRKKN